MKIQVDRNTIIIPNEITKIDEDKDGKDIGRVIMIEYQLNKKFKVVCKTTENRDWLFSYGFGGEGNFIKLNDFWNIIESKDFVK